MSYIIKEGSGPKYTARTGTEDEYPYNRLIGCYFTLWGAKRACQRADEGRDKIVVWRSTETDAMRKRIAELEKELGIK